jgi:hypothetical protein
MLIKIDIEGAEGKALQGASQVMSRLRPTVLLSIHPKFLIESGSSKEKVLGSLMSQGYRAALLSVDHEEHWWCEPLPK